MQHPKRLPREDGFLCCPLCVTYRAPSEFASDRTRWDGLARICKECARGRRPAQRECVWCGTVFDVGVRGVIGRYCSDLCRKSVSRWGVPSRNEDEKDRSPAVWDGVTEISKAPREYDWRVYCMLCGGQEYKRATLETMRAVRWLSPCERCGGVRWIEEDYGGRMLLSERPTRGGDEMDGPRPIHEGVPWKQPA